MKKKICFAFFMGLCGELYLTIPALGVIPMLDVFAYSVSIILMVANWKMMGRQMQKSVLFGLFWSFAAFFAGLTSSASLREVLKEIVVVSSSWAIMVVAWCVLKTNAKLYMVYLVGYALGAYIGLYYFKQGVWQAMELSHDGLDLMEIIVDKQRYPIIANLYFYGIILLLALIVKKFPTFIIPIGCFYGGWFLLMNGGSRSNFGFYMVAALMACLSMLGQKVQKSMYAHKTFFVVGGLAAVAIIFGSYKAIVKSGAMGEGELRKYEGEFENRGNISNRGLMGRAGLSLAIEEFCRRPWGNGPNYGKHSAFTSAMAREGIVGAIFWIFFWIQVYWFVANRVTVAGKYAPFLILMITNATWASMGSPFGARHTFFVLMAYIAICRDNRGYGVPEVFNVPQCQVGYFCNPRMRVWR